MQKQYEAVIAAEERARMAALLARYPNLTENELAEIHNWFDRVASALDIGLLSSQPEIAEQYRAYRAEHIDRFTKKDLAKAGLFVVSVLGVVVLIALAVP